MTHTLTVGGQKVRTRTNRRYAVVAYRAEPYVGLDGRTYQPFAETVFRTDNYAKAQKRAEYRPGAGIRHAVFDLTTVGSNREPRRV